MDRDQRWDRTERGYDAIVHAEGLRAPSADDGHRGGLRAWRDRRVRRADGHRRHRRRPARPRPDRPRQLPRRPRAPARPRARRPGLRRLRPHQPDRSPGPARPARGDAHRVRGGPARPGRLRARGRTLARRDVQRAGLDAVPRRGDREVRARHVLLQRRRRGRVAGRGAPPGPVAQGRDLRPPAGDERGRASPTSWSPRSAPAGTTSSSRTTRTRTWWGTRGSGTPPSRRSR